MYIYVYTMIEVYIYMLTPPGPTFFLFHGPFHCKVNYLLSAERKHKHKKMHWRAFSAPPIPKSVSQNFGLFGCFLFFCVRSFFLGTSTPPLPKPNAKQVIQNVCMLILSGVGERW